MMTAETDAAIDGAVDSRATEILVNDAHGSMRNLIIEDLHAPAELISGRIKPMGMMEGIDEMFDAAIFIGVHARAAGYNGILTHTGSGTPCIGASPAPKSVIVEFSPLSCRTARL